MNNIDLCDSCYIVSPMRSAKLPKANPMTTKVSIMSRFSFFEGLRRQRIMIPTPAFGKRPASIVPVDIMPIAPRVEIATDAAHPGTRPRTAKIRCERKNEDFPSSERLSVPIKKISELTAKVTAKINRVILRV